MKDTASTIAGGGAGLFLLSSVRWEVVPFGESVKVAVALLLAIVGYLMYRAPEGPRPPNPPAVGSDLAL